MATAKCYAENGTERGTLELPEHLFACEVNEPVIHQAVVAYLANQRQGTASAKGRSEVRGGGRKPFRQKGTGRARQGTIRSPLLRGGGVVFGPHNRDYRQALPKKIKRLALRSSLSSRAKDGAVVVVDDLKYKEPKTRKFVELMNNLGLEGKCLFVIGEKDPAVSKSAHNIPGVKVALASMLTTYDIVWADRIVLTQGALKVMEEVWHE